MTSSVKHVLDWRKRTKDRMIKSMGGKCQCCGYNKCSAALEFHHINPEQKKFTFGSVRSNNISWRKIVEELKKCILLCSNCHREIEYNKKKLPSKYAKFNNKYEDYFEEKLARYKKYRKDLCPICGELKNEIRKNCSVSCYTKSREKVDWNSIDLLKLKKTLNNVQIGKMLGVSEQCIRKRLKKYRNGS